MTSRHQPIGTVSGLFDDDEPVLQSLPLLPGATSPTFGETEQWDFNGVLARPAKHTPGEWRLPLDGLSPVQNLLAREVVMIEFNPRHPAVLAAGLHLLPTPRKVATARGRGQVLHALARFGAAHDLPDDFSQWQPEDFHRYLAMRRSEIEDIALRPHITVIKLLHRLAPALTYGLPVDPWPGRNAAKVLGLIRDDRLRTPVVEPGTWFPLVRAAWTYVDVFGPDILKARAEWKALQAAQHDRSDRGPREQLDRWLADPDSRVPVWHPDDPLRPRRGDSSVNWSLLTAMVNLPGSSALFNTGSAWARRNRALIEEQVAAGRTQPGLLRELAEVDRPDGTRGSWIPSLHPPALWIEYTALRNAAFVLTVALSMMRDTELRDIPKDGVVEYYGSPAVKSTKHKLDPDLPVKHWWVIEPVARAIATASELSLHDEHAFASVQEKSPIHHFDSRDAINSFVRHANDHRHHTGLPHIPGRRLAPHMFRRTMAMLTRELPGSEIAVGMQLKHVATRALANVTTHAYMQDAPSWAQHLTTAIAEHRFERLTELFDADSRGEVIGFGPGADQLREAFAAIRARAAQLAPTNQAQRGDARVEHDLLRRTHLSVRFGTLNHCTMNDSNPVGARCLEDAIVPEGHTGPLIDRCRPSRCANSVIAPAHLPIWQAERASLTELLGLPRLPANRKAHLKAQLAEVDLVLRKAER